MRHGMAYGDWRWQQTFDENGQPDGGEWLAVAGSANHGWDEAVRLDGEWSQSSGAAGENLALSEAMNRDHSVEPGDFLPGEVFTSASGSYSDEAEIPPSHDLLPYPNTPGQTQGEVQTTFNSELYAGLSYSSQIRELRLRRSAEGSRGTHIVRGFMVETTDTDSLTGESTTTCSGMTLDIPPGAEESAGMVVLDAKTTAPNTARHVNVKDYEIKPHSSMYNADGSGRLGDLVPSVLPDSKVKHFVTPK